MKKITLMVSCLMSAMVVFGAVDLSKYTPIDHKTATEEDYRAIYPEVLSMDNGEDANKILNRTSFSGIAFNPKYQDLVNEFDEGLASKFTRGEVGWPFSGKFKKIGVLRSKALGWESRFPTIMAVKDKYSPKDVRYAYILVREGASLEELVSCMVEFIHYVPDDKVGFITEPLLKGYKKEIQTLASKNIKRKLREKGISFVAKEGKNPCEEYLTRLRDALDAPNFAGLNEWLSELGYNVQVDTSKLISKEQLASLKDAVFYGDVPMTENRKVHLLVGLGVDGYNQFVKDYNGEK